MRKIEYTDLKNLNDFEKYGDKFTKIYADDENHIYIYKRVSRYGVAAFELVKGVKAKNPDGSIVYRYPSSEQFGISGWYIMDNDRARDRISWLMKNKLFYFNFF